MKTALASTLLAFASLAARAVVPDTCAILTVDEINSVAGGTVTKVQPVRSGNPSECNFLDSRKAAVLSIKMREVQYAAPDELRADRESDEKVYKAHTKDVKAVGEHAYWSDASHQLAFHKGKILVYVTFQQKKNANEVDSAQIARMIEQRIK